MITRKRAARRDSECSSNSRQQDSPLPSVLESIPKVNNSNNLVTNPARIEAQLSRNLSSKKKRRYSYEQAKPKNTTAMNELETHNSTQSSSDCSRQPKPGTSTNTKAEPKPKSKPELIVDAESGSERELDSKSKVKTETEAKAKAKGKVKAVAEVELKAKPEVIQSKVGTENEPKLNVDSKSMAKAEVKPKLVPAKGGPENESNHSNAKENVPPKNQVLHRAVRPCVRLMKLFLPKKAVKSEEFITVLNNICIDKSDPSYYVHYELPGPERCAYCMKKYKPDKLQNHMLMKHWSIVVYSALLCPLCDSVFTDHLQLASHAIVDHAIMSNLCIICNHERISQESLIKHYQCEILSNTIHRCRFCQSYFSKLDSVKQHLQDKHFIMMEE